MDLDKGTVKVQRAPVQLPPRPRRKLVQSLEQYAPLSASEERETTTSGPPMYVQEAYPHSRLTLFCSVSRAPRWGKKPDCIRPVAASTFSTITSASSIQEPSPTVSRRSSTNTLGRAAGMNASNLPKIPKVDFEKETLIEGFKEPKAADESLMDHVHNVAGSPEDRSILSSTDPKEWKTNKVAPEQVQVTEIVAYEHFHLC